MAGAQRRFRRIAPARVAAGFADNQAAFDELRLRGIGALVKLAKEDFGGFTAHFVCG